MTSSLRQRLAEPRPLLAPGVYDALTALVAEQAGFEALYLSGASIAYTRLGRSDVGLTTFTEVQDTLARITERVGIPVVVDADTGFGNAINLQRTVRGMERAGAAMVQLEDQGFPKRCGHLDGKTVVGTAEMCGKLRAALDARHSASTLILARTDALALEGLNAALDRAEPRAGDLCDPAMDGQTECVKPQPRGVADHRMGGGGDQETSHRFGVWDFSADRPAARGRTGADVFSPDDFPTPQRRGIGWSDRHHTRRVLSDVGQDPGRAGSIPVQYAPLDTAHSPGPLRPPRAGHQSRSLYSGP